MLDKELARIRAHRNIIDRYRRLLKASLSDVESQFVERRLTEDQAALGSLSVATFPLAFSLRNGVVKSEARTTRAFGTTRFLAGGLIMRSRGGK